MNNDNFSQIAINERFIKFYELVKIRKKNNNDKEFCRLYNIDYNYFNNLKRNETSFKADKVFEFLESEMLNMNWLFTGKGEMQLDNKETTEIAYETIENYTITQLSTNKLPGRIQEAKPIPLYDIKATAGGMELIFPQTLSEETLLYLPELRGCDFAVKVFGDSMEGVVDNGDTVACKNINGVHEIINGKIYLIQTERNLYIKYVYKNRVGLILNSANVLHEPIILEMSEVTKIYEVVWDLKLKKV